MEEILHINLSGAETYKIFQELHLKDDDIFIPVGNFDKYVVQVLPDLMVPPALNLGDVMLMSRRWLLVYAESMCWDVNRYQVKYEEQIFEFAEMEDAATCSKKNRAKEQALSAIMKLIN